MRPTSGEVPHRCARYLRLVGIGVVSTSVRGTKRTSVIDALMSATDPGCVKTPDFI